MRTSDTSNDSDCANFLKALGDPTRLQIVKALLAGAMTVTDLANLLEIEIANVSHHLRVLYHAKLVTTERDGKYIYYQLHESLKATGKHQKLDFGCCQLNLPTKIS